MAEIQESGNKKGGKSKQKKMIGHREKCKKKRINN